MRAINDAWPEASVKILKRMLAEGYSASRIARAIGNGMSRSAVCGKAHRLRLSKPANVVHRRANAAPPRERKVKSLPAEAAVELPALVLDDGSNVTLLTLTRGMCRWPIGDPADATFHFCGHPPFAKRPYCEAHCVRASGGRSKV